MIFLLVSLFLSLYFDARLLKEKNPEHYRGIMQFPPLRWAVYATAACVAMLPIYLLRRRRFFRTGVTLLDRRETALSDLFDVLLHWLCGVLLCSVAMKLIALGVHDFRGSLLSVLLVSGFSSFWLVWLIAQLSRRPGRDGFASTVAARKPQKSVLKAFGLAILIGILFAGISAYILQARVENPSTPLGEALQGNNSSWVFLLFLMLGLCVAPLLEELIFRGYFFNVLETFQGTSVATVIIAGLFALMHVGQYWGDWMAILMVMLLGLEITLLRAWSGSVIPGIVTHYLYNALVFLLPSAFLFLSNPAYMKYVTEYDHLGVKEKEELLLTSIHAHPEFSDSYNELAWLYAENHVHTDEALKLIEQALYGQPDNAAYLDTKAEILFSSGKKKEAAAIAEKIVARFPSNEYYRGQLEKFSGRAKLSPRNQPQNGPHR